MSKVRFIVLVAATVLTTACRETERGNTGECQSNTDCPAAEPYCDTSRNVCVACYSDDQCGCHEMCSNDVCVPIGATSDADKINAHGNWQGTPGQANYSFKGYCDGNDDCLLGQICNPFTSACILVADYQTGCNTRGECPAGLACNPANNKCIPAALCSTTRNCCDTAGFACDTGASLCLPQVIECTPPAPSEVTSECPMQPRLTDECQSGRFCAPSGKCVQCVCDGDCDAGSGLPYCYGALGRCVPEGFCTRAEECGQGQACDTRANFCADACDSNDDCDLASEFCDTTDHVCRPVSDRPCVPDTFEPNDSRATAQSRAVMLTVPAVNESTQVDALSACSSDGDDWYGLALTRGDRVQISGSSTEGLEADLTAYGPDGSTELDDGRISPLGNELVDFTANFDGTYWLYVNPDYESYGTYRLSISRLVGVVCSDTFEDTNGLDNTLETAQLLNPDTGSAPTGCTLTGAFGSNQTIACGSNGLKLCLGDVDYYLIDVPAGATLTVQLNGSAGDIDSYLYGPFLDGETLTTTRQADSSSASGTAETLEHMSRTGGRYVVHAYRYSGENPTYSLSATITAGVACTEDIYDEDTSTPEPFDVSGFNDSSDARSGIAVQVGTPRTISLTACRGDRDWFQVGLDGGGGSLANLPAGHELLVEILNVTPSPATQLLAYGGTSATTLESTLSNDNWGAQSLTVRPTSDNPYYVIVRPLSTGIGPFTYELRFTLSPPPACTPDTLGDGAGGNESPAAAYSLTGGSWPDAAGESHSVADLSLCGADDDWYQLTPPTGTKTVATVTFDPDLSEIGLALYDGTVTGATITPGTPPSTGQLDLGDLAGAGFQWVRGAPGATGYLLAYNDGGWPTQYDLTLHYLPAACSADASEPNNSDTQATPVTLTPSSLDPRLQTALVGPLSVCAEAPSGSDWFAVNAGPGDRVVSALYLNPDEGEIWYYLYGPGPVDDYNYVDYDYSAYAGTRDVLVLDYTVPEDEAPGDYRFLVEPYSWYGTTTYDSIYFAQFAVLRACAEDAWEPSSQASPHTIAWGSLPVTDQALALCRDQDWYAITPAADTTLSVCLEFTHTAGDIDLAVLAGSTSGTVVQSSVTKNDYESVSFSATGGTTYYIKVAYDTSSVNKNSYYTMSVAEGAIGCP